MTQSILSDLLFNGWKITDISKINVEQDAGQFVASATKVLDNGTLRLVSGRGDSFAKAISDLSGNIRNGEI